MRTICMTNADAEDAATVKVATKNGFIFEHQTYRFEGFKGFWWIVSATGAVTGENVEFILPVGAEGRLLEARLTN